MINMYKKLKVIHIYIYIYTKKCIYNCRDKSPVIIYTLVTINSKYCKDFRDVTIKYIKRGYKDTKIITSARLKISLNLSSFRLEN